MFRNNRKKLFNAMQLNYLNLGLTGGALGGSSYLAYISQAPTCVFCLSLRLLLVLLTGLSLGSIFIAAHRRLIYPGQLAGSIIGFLLSVRQVYFEQTATRFASCPKVVSNPIKTIFNWLYAGAPVCQKTMLLGPLTLASWTCIFFAVLSLVSFQLYYSKQFKRR
jgi:disulfide bond formation protein DsbB